MKHDLSALKSLVFDNDDTIILSYGTRVANFQAAGQEAGVRVPTGDDIKAVWNSPTLQALVANVWPETTEEEREAIISCYSSKRQDSYPLAERALEVLGEARRRYVTGMLTTRDREALMAKLTGSGIDPEIFGFISTSDDTGYHKPNPRAFEKVLEKLDGEGILPREAAYVDDSVPGYLSSEGAGLVPISVLTGMTGRLEFLEAGQDPELIIPSIAELPGLLGWEG